MFCYGKNWSYHKRLFEPATFRPELDGRVEIARLGKSTILLTPLFATFLVTNPLVEDIVRLTKVIS